MPALCPLGAQLQLVVLITELDPGFGRQLLGQGTHRLRPGKVEVDRGGAIHREGEGEVGQDADIAAGREAQSSLERLPGGIVEAQREAYLPLITLGAEPGYLEVTWHWPTPLKVSDRLVPQDLGRYAPFSRAVPVGFPARLQLDIEQDAGLICRAAVGLQPYPGVIILWAGEPARVAGQSHGLPQQTAQ